MAINKKLAKGLTKLSEEDLRDTLSFLAEDDEAKQTKEENKEETKEEVTKEEESTQEEKKEEKPSYVTREDLETFMKDFANNFATKEETKEVKEAVEKTKAFGVTTAKEKPKAKETQKSSQDYLNILKNQGY